MKASPNISLKKQIPSSALSLLIAGMAWAWAPSSSASVLFLDDFSTDTSADYIGTDTFGSGGSFTVSGGTLNVTSAASNTHDVFYNTALLGIGQTVSVDVTGPDDTYLTVSTTTRGPNTSGQDGVRLLWEADGTFRARNYDDGTESTVFFHSSFDVAEPGPLTLYLTREGDNTFSAAFDSGSGLTQLNTTGGTEKQIFTAGDTGNGDLYFGVETWNNVGTRNFDNLTVTPEPSSTALLGLGGLALALRRRR